MKSSLRLLTPFVLAVAANAQVPSAPELPPGAVAETRTNLRFTLIPKAFQANPTLEMTAFTESTPFGRSLAAVSPDNPVYYVGHSEGYHAMGAGMGGNHPPVRESLERMVTRSLRERGLLEAVDRAHPPQLALFFYWGSHATLDNETAARFPDLYEQYIVERATLVGGRAYAKRINEEFEFGRNPVSNVKEDYMRYQAVNELYFVVVSAYAFDHLARGERRLAWRTTLTVNGQGISMSDSLPALVASGGYYFGRETPESVAIHREVRRGTVNLGPLRVIEGDFMPRPPGRNR